MVIALFALSLVMIVGGAAAVVQGFPYVRLESGLAMVIGGTTAASAGAVLLGIAVAILQMRKLAEAFGRRGTELADEPVSIPAVTAPAPVPSAPALRGPAFDDVSPGRSELPTATAGAAGLAGIGLGGMRDLLGTGDTHAGTDSLSHRAMEVEPPLPNLLPPMAEEPVVADEDLFAAPDDRPGHGRRAAADAPLEDAQPDDATGPDPAQEELALRPALEEPQAPASPEVSPSVAEAPPAPEEDAPKPEGLQVVGTYSSGANTYVMFANGTIQADTPRGQFSFQSLDELKEFVDSGGETNARGAA